MHHAEFHFKTEVSPDSFNSLRCLSSRICIRSFKLSSLSYPKNFWSGSPIYFEINSTDMLPHLFFSSSCSLHNLHNDEMLCLAQRAALRDLHDIPFLGRDAFRAVDSYSAVPPLVPLEL